MEVYLVEKDDLTRVPPEELEQEQLLEDHLDKLEGATIGGVECMYIARQQSTAGGGILDILAVDEEGNTVVIELKRGQAPRDIITQALEYASDLRGTEYAELDNWFQTYLQQQSGPLSVGDSPDPTLAEAHSEFFELESELDGSNFNNTQRLLLVGTEFKNSTIEMVEYLRAHGIDANCVEYRAYATEDGDIELLTTESLHPPIEQESDTDSEELTEYKKRQLEFWEGFVETVRSRETPVAPDAPQPNHALSDRLGRTGIRIVYFILFRDDAIRCRFTLEGHENLFQEFLADREEIEAEFSEVELRWEGENQKRKKILAERSVDASDRDQWDDYYEWLLDVGETMHEVFGPRI